MDPEVDSTGRLSQASSEMLFGALLQQTQDQVYFKDKRSRFVKASDAVVEKLGAKSMDDLIGKSDFDFFAAEHAQRTFDAEQRLMTEGKRLTNITEKEIWPDGTVTWATSTKIPLYLGEGNLVGLMGITRDITDRVKAEQALEESRELLRRKNEVMETDLENARRIQKSLIPGPIPNLYFAEVGVVNQAMMDVCGDVITF
ncbi:MAG: PAS domain S-box protein, partial [Verrucomicrobiota bacterium]